MESDNINFNFQDDYASLLDLYDSLITTSEPENPESQSLLSSQLPKSTSSKTEGKASGRRKKQFTAILEKFYSKKSNRSPKPEYINTFIIRAIKRAFRNIKKGVTPKTSCIAVDVKIPSEMQIWSKMLKIYRDDPDNIDFWARTESGPLTDGKAKREDQDEGCEKCFTNSFCKSFFSDFSMQLAFDHLISLIYVENSPARCCSKFGFYCCPDKERTIAHSHECELKWNELQDYFLYEYFKELDVQRLVELSINNKA